MKTNRTRAPPFRGQRVVFYPAIRRYVPTFSSRLTPLVCQIAAMRANGHSIEDLRAWVHERTGWKPGERAIYRTLAKQRRGQE
jgi:hypothetical protein